MGSSAIGLKWCPALNMEGWSSAPDGAAGVGPQTGDGTDGVHEVDGVRGGPRSEAKCLAPVGPHHWSLFLLLQGRECADSGLNMAEAARESDASGWAAGGFTRVPTQVGYPSGELSEGRNGAGPENGSSLFTVSEKNDRPDFSCAELDACGEVWLGTRQPFDPFDTRGHGGKQSSPFDDRFLGPELGLLDTAGSALPRAMEVFDAPALRVGKNDLTSLFERTDRTVGQQQPLNGFFALGCGRLFASPYDVQRCLHVFLRSLVAQIERDRRCPDDDARHTLATLGSRTDGQVVAAEHARR